MMTTNGQPEHLSTGNEFISIPRISASTAGIQGFGFMHRGFRACIELRGSDRHPLIKPRVEVDGVDIFDGGVEAELLSYWVPRFTVVGDSMRAVSTVFAPLDRRGFICVLELENTSDRSVTVKAGWKGCYESTYHAANLSKLMAGVKHVSMSSWRPGIPVIEYRGHIPLFAVAFMSQEVMPTQLGDGGGLADINRWSAEGLIAHPGKPIFIEFTDQYVLAPGEKKTIPAYIGIGLEEVSAVASAEELRLHGWERTLASLVSWLDSRTIECEDEYFKRMVNVNSFYNYFFSQGVALDTEELFVTRARSARNEFCASYGDRDALVWSMPAVLQVDWSQARQMLLHAFTVQLQNVGIKSRYLSGIVLEPGLQLDQLCAPINALHFYAQLTGDMSVLFDRRVQAGINTIQQILAAQRHPDVALFETLLSPSGEPSRYPYVCYSNVIVWRSLRDAAILYDRIRDLDRSFEAAALADKMRAAIMDNFVVQGPYGEMFARAIDMEGSFELGDDPAGSLQMLSYHGFCSPESPVYANTVKWIHSEYNPLSNCGLPFSEPAECGGSGPSILSVVNDLLTGRKEEALDFLRRASLDSGIACESVGRTTGRAVSGHAHASIAGYLAYGLRNALGMTAPAIAAVAQQRRPGEALYQPPPPEASQAPKKARM